MSEERNSGVLAVHTMTGHTVMGERLLAVGNRVRRRSERVLLVFVPDEKVVFRNAHDVRFRRIGGRGFTSHGRDEQRGHDEWSNPLRLAHGYCTT